MAVLEEAVMLDSTGQDIAEALSTMATGATSTTIAPQFSESLTYAVGNRVIYNKALYRCTTAVTVAGAWDPSKWTAETVADALASMDSSLAGKVNTSDTITIEHGGTGATSAAAARTNLGLGTASTKNSTYSITSGGAGLPTSGTIYSYTNPVVITASGSSAPSDTRALWVYPES